LEAWNPCLAEKLLKTGYFYENGVKYKLNRKGSHVHMIPARMCADPRPESPKITEPNTEKSKARILGRMKNQKLLELK
jgi:hypothetical protein